MPGTRKKLQTLLDAVQQNDAAQVTMIAAKLKLGEEDKYYDTCAAAVRQGAGEALDALLKAAGGFNFTGRSLKEWNERRYDEQDARNRKLALQLVEEACALPDPKAVLSVLYKNRKNVLYKDRKDRYHGETCYLFPADILKQGTRKEALDVFLQENTSESFSECMTRTGLTAAGTDKLEHILSFASGRDSSTINKALVTVAADGDTDKAALLLKHGADPNADDTASLLTAAKADRHEMVDLLLPHISFDSRGVKGDKIVTQLKYNGADPAIVESIEKATQKLILKTLPLIQQDERFRRLNDTTLEEVQALSDGLTLSMLFNFSTRQQILVTHGANNSLSPPTAVSFDNIPKDVIDDRRKKFDALANTAASTPSTTAADTRRRKLLQNAIK